MYSNQAKTKRTKNQFHSYISKRLTGALCQSVNLFGVLLRHLFKLWDIFILIHRSPRRRRRCSIFSTRGQSVLKCGGALRTQIQSPGSDDRCQTWSRAMLPIVVNWRRWNKIADLLACYSFVLINWIKFKAVRLPSEMLIIFQEPETHWFVGCGEVSQWQRRSTKWRRRSIMFQFRDLIAHKSSVLWLDDDLQWNPGVS